MSNLTLSQIARGANIVFAPTAAEAFHLAQQANPALKLEELTPEDKAVLNSWFQRYYGIQITQVSNLRATINNPTKHLALDLVALMKPEVQDRAGLSTWFPKPKQ
jgi:hypothetical protein